jgi:hypothetical protein
MNSNQEPIRLGKGQAIDLVQKLLRNLDQVDMRLIFLSCTLPWGICKQGDNMSDNLTSMVNETTTRNANTKITTKGPDRETAQWTGGLHKTYAEAHKEPDLGAFDPYCLLESFDLSVESQPIG